MFFGTLVNSVVNEYGLSALDGKIFINQKLNYSAVCVFYIFELVSMICV